MLRRTSSTKGIDDLDVERCYGDVFDDDALRAAMTGCDVVYYCVVDARMWLRDPEPLFRTNVEGLRHVLDAALDANLKKFVFTSTIGALAISDSRLVTEDDPHNWNQGGAYIEARVAAEEYGDVVRTRQRTARGRHVRSQPPMGPAIGRRLHTAPCWLRLPPAVSRSTWIIRPKWWASKMPPGQCFSPPNTGETANATSSPTDS